ncbi:MAG: hypothetical protein IJH34_01015, partial [Romboutsia sp.]|nr:hypothetical protein [Romboutsia sp.]
MNLFLTNNSKKSSLTLRYGDGLNKAVQIPALGIKPAPIELLTDVKLLRSYTHVFKNLEIVRDE